MKNINSKWMIEETYTSDKCRHRVGYFKENGMLGYCKCAIDKKIKFNDRPICTKANCKIKVGK